MVSCFMTAPMSYPSATGCLRRPYRVGGPKERRCISRVKISTAGGSLTVVDYFTMYNEVAESAADQDLGSGGELLLPDMTDSTNTVRHLVVGAGKDAIIYVVDRDNMGKFDSTKNNIWQQLNNALGGEIRSSPAYFNGN